jgi:hypothetical protein
MLGRDPNVSRRRGMIDPASWHSFRPMVRENAAARRLARPAAVLTALAACFAAASHGHAQNHANGDVMAGIDARRSVPVSVHRLTGQIKLDGTVDEAEWSNVEPLPMAMHSPTFLAPLTEVTEVRIAHDDEYLYLSGRLLDSEPSGIRTNTFYRDAYSGDDLLAVVIDSYNDYETAVWFVTNPAGARNDRTVSNDGVFTGEMPMNSDWNSHWEVKTRQDDTGWSAEFRIPFSTLGFQTVDGEVVMGVIVYRYIARKNERQTYPAIDPKWGGLAFAKPSQAQRVRLRNVRQSRPVYVSPYALGGVKQFPALREVAAGASAWRTESDATREVGVDLRYSPTSNLALDLTVNTDFAQVEADDQQINLTRFPLFFPEKRQFFQERASTFQFNTGGSTDRLFHSRRIGLLDSGDVVRIYAGTRAVGRIGGMDYGLLNMQTASHGQRASENMGVLRLQQQVLNPFSSIGAMITSRLGSNGQDNIAYGVDAVLQPFGDERITARWAQTFDEAIDEESPVEAGLMLARWERVRDEGLSYAGEFLRVGGDYNPGLGFQARRDFRFFGGRLQYKKYPGANSRLRAAGFQISTGHYIRDVDGAVESRSFQPQFRLEFKDGTEAEFTARSNYESVSEDFTVADATIPAGRYWFHEGQARLQLPRSDIFRGDFTATAGTFYDGTRIGLALNPAWNPSKYLELGGGYEINRLAFSDRDQQTTAHLARLKVQVALNTRLSFNTFAQFSNLADLASFNARFRYHFREGTDLWIVYTEGVNTNREIAGEPNLPASAGRTLMLKYSHTFIW